MDIDIAIAIYIDIAIAIYIDIAIATEISSCKMNWLTVSIFFSSTCIIYPKISNC